MGAKKRIDLFVSYARSNKTLANKFLKRYGEQAGASKNYHYVFWKDTDILVGEDWHAAIDEALKKCDIGLLLISPAFLLSNYISENELPKFVGSGTSYITNALDRNERMSFIQKQVGHTTTRTIVDHYYRHVPAPDDGNRLEDAWNSTSILPVSKDSDLQVSEKT